MSLGKIGTYSIVAGILAALLAVVSLLSKNQTLLPPKAKPYGEWEESIGI
jgi:uncharacterized membrane protein